MLFMIVIFYVKGYQMNFFFFWIIHFYFDDSVDETCVNL